MDEIETAKSAVQASNLFPSLDRFKVTGQRAPNSWQLLMGRIADLLGKPYSQIPRLGKKYEGIPHEWLEYCLDQANGEGVKNPPALFNWKINQILGKPARSPKPSTLSPASSIISLGE